MVILESGITLKGKDSIKLVQSNILGAIIISVGRCMTEIKSHMGQAKVAFVKTKNILCNK